MSRRLTLGVLLSGILVGSSVVIVFGVLQTHPVGTSRAGVGPMPPPIYEEPGVVQGSLSDAVTGQVLNLL